MSEAMSVFDLPPQEFLREPNFMSLAASFGYKEDEDGEMLRKLCTETTYRDETHYGEGILGYIRHCDKTYYSSEVQSGSNRLGIRQGIWIALASLHYDTGHYANCMSQLWDAHDDILHSNDLSHLGEVSWLLHYVGAREMGKRATISHISTTQQEHTPDFTGEHFEIPLVRD